MEAAQLVVKLLHHLGLLLEPAMINVWHNFAAFLKSETDVETIHEQSNFHFQEISSSLLGSDKDSYDDNQRTLDGACG